MAKNVARAKKRTDTVGFFVRLPRAQVDDIRKDASSNNKTVDGITAVALQHHFCYKTEERRIRYAALPAKRLGRKVAS